jgi:hypothetical protein
MMSRYALLLYAGEADPEEKERREAEMPLWVQLNESLRDAGLLVTTDRLEPPDLATTVRVHEGETELIDGPFAVTKEFLVGFYVLECADLDEAVAQAARLPVARYGSVEVRPVMDTGAESASNGAAGE